MRSQYRVWLTRMSGLLAALLTHFALAQAPSQPNILVVLADDFGPDLLSGYRDVLLAERASLDPNCANDPNCAPDPPCTPNLDAFMSQGVRFTRVWASPICSPARAQVLTGLYSFRNGIGNNTDLTQDLRFSRKPLPTALREAGYLTAAVGKWHLSMEQSPFPWDAPTQQDFIAGANNARCGGDEYAGAGFDYYAGSAFNLSRTIGVQGLPGSYGNWQKNLNGTPVSDYCTYATLDTIDDAIALVDPVMTLPSTDPNFASCGGPIGATADFDLANNAQPWFLYLSLNAPHLPAHNPSDFEARLCPPLADPNLSACYSCDDELLDARLARYLQVRAMVESIDVEFGRLMQHVDLSETIVIFMGDNGTDKDAIAPRRLYADSPWQCFLGKAKTSPYEAGLRVPLMIAGPGIPAGESRDTLISIVDLYATLCELAGSAERPHDSVSFAPQLQPGGAPDARQMLYAERFQTNFDAVCSDHRQEDMTQHVRVVRGDRFKLIRTRWNEPGCNNNQMELYDLLTDPFEEVNLLSNPNTMRDPGVIAPATYDDYCALRCEMMRLGVDVPRVNDACGNCDACLDPDRDGDFDLTDVSILLGEFGRNGNYASDLDRDGDVDLADLATVIARFGNTCETWL